MKKHFSFMSLALFSATIYAQTQTFQWSAVQQKTAATEGAFVNKDSGGNIYVTGYHASVPNDNGSSSLGSFISKYNSSGTLQWSNDYTDMELRTVIDNNDNLLVTGQDRSGYYIAKYNTSGS